MVSEVKEFNYETSWDTRTNDGLEQREPPRGVQTFQTTRQADVQRPAKLKPEEDKCSYLLIWVGKKGRDVYNTWTLGGEERKKLKTFYDKFEGYVTPKANPARYKFHNKVQDQDKSVDQFVTELRLLAKDCGFSDTDEMIRDRIVFGTSSRKVRERLINEGATLTLSKAIDSARTVETSKSTLESMEKQTSEVHSVRRFPRDGQKSKQSGDT